MQDPFGNRFYGSNEAVSGPRGGRGRPDDPYAWPGMGASGGNTDPTSGRAIPDPAVDSTALRSSSANRPDPQTYAGTTPGTAPGFMPDQFKPAAGGTVNSNGAYVPPGSTSGSGSGASTPPASPFPSGGMNPNPTPVQQFRWAPGGGPNPGQLNAAAPDGPLAPEYAGMQDAVAANVQRNQNTRPTNYSIATNNPGVWIDPSTGGTWNAPGVGSYNSWEVFGTDRANPNSPYVLPGGSYQPNRQTGALTRL